MTFDDDLRKELQQRLDPIGSPAEWEPVRDRMTAARARRDRTRAAIAGTVAASLALGGITLAWNERKDPVGAASHPSGVPSPSFSPLPSDDGADIVAPVVASAALPPDRDCPDGWRFFVNPILHFDVCYPDDWGFPTGRDLPNRELISGDELYGGVTLESPDFPYYGPDPGAYNPYVIRLSIYPGVPRTAEGECDYEETLEVVDATARWCETNADPGADSVTFSDDAPVRFMKMAIPFGVQPQPAGARKADPNDELNVLGEARRELWDEHRDTIFTILRSIRPHQEPLPDNELSLPLYLVSIDGRVLTLEARPYACGAVDRLEVNETPTSVQIRAVGSRGESTTIGSDDPRSRPPLQARPRHRPPVRTNCEPTFREATVELKEPLGQRQLDYALVSSDFAPDEQAQCRDDERFAERAAYPVRRHWEDPGDAMKHLLARYPWLVVSAEAFVPTGSVRGQRAWIYRTGGRTRAAIRVYNFGEGWIPGWITYCL